ncbi:MAG: hypothetical protein LIR25_02295, partial [bacterium]|nr:hypothetical protein [bacterium]
MDLYWEKLAGRLASIIETKKDKVAYIMGDKKITYAQMDEMACHIASGVARMVEGQDADPAVPVRIGICLGRHEHV